MFHIASQGYIENQKLFLEFLEKNENAKLLDVGCADGRFTMECAHKIGCNEIFGVEIDRVAARKAEERGVRVKVCDANNRMPFKNRSFDVVTANQVLEHIKNTDRFLTEVHRVLKDNGYLVLSTPNLASVHNLGLLVLGMQPVSYHVSEIQVGNFLRRVKTHGHVSIFTLPGLKDFLSYHGFSIENIRGSGFYPLPRFLARAVSRIFPRYSVYIILKARKKVQHH
jgi:2-polyprenyl-3-methyl-5-hydroxy-6-metoxy-1,4-benzoquinol methylase